MFLTTFMSATVRGVLIESAAAEYADWALGLHAGAPQRRRRIDEGIVDSWTPEMLMESRSLVGRVGCRVEMRVDPDRMSFRFVHRDERDNAVFWHSAARAKRVGDSLVIQHGVARDAPRGHFLAPISSPSRVLLKLFGQPGVVVTPRDLLSEPVWLDAPAAVRGFVSHVLARSDRDLPLLVVACERNGLPPLMDPEQLGRRLRGLCAVATLGTQDATYEFSSAMADAGFGQSYRCYNGAAHLYGPTAAMQDDHRLWLGDSIREIRPDERVEHLAGVIAGRFAVRETPRGFFTQIEEHDRQQRRDLALRLSEKRSSPPPADMVPKEYVARAEKEQNELRDALLRSLESEKSFEEEWTKAEEARQQAEREREQAEAKLEQERALSQYWRDEFTELKAKAPVAGVDADLRGAIEAALNDRLTPHDCLVFVRRIYAERIVVLESAFASANDACDFKHGGKLLKLLRQLGGGYWDTLCSGKGDTVAKDVFGDKAFAPNESTMTKNNKRAIDERTFSYGKRKIVMWPHLKIGTAETTAETIRVHFEWVPEEKKIVIGWCGEHRYRVA
jgi:hypothetical protein